jgi:hypothetical protein
MRRTRPRIVGAVGWLAIALFTSAWLVAGGIGRPSDTFASPHADEPWPAEASRAREFRDDALRRASVWRPVLELVDLSANPPDPTLRLSDTRVECRFLAHAADGTTPKFDCVLRNGDIVKVKYGRNPEIQGEVAASRLLTALGFGADTNYLIEHLRCYGCPRFPFQTTRLLGFAGVGDLLEHTGEHLYVDFNWVAVERRFGGRPIVGDRQKGWDWTELPKEGTTGGASRTELDALRLMAVFLAHWDNKAQNQRLVCLSEQEGDPHRPCPQPFAIIQDLGSTFGPYKVDLSGWRGVPIWSNPSQCLVSLKRLPYNGATFDDTRISEAGREHLAKYLGALTTQQIEGLFRGARFAEYEHGRWLGFGIDDFPGWVGTFREKVSQIVDRGPCPT